MSLSRPNAGVGAGVVKFDDDPPFPTLVRHPFDQIVGTSRQLRAVVEWARIASHATTPVLLLGETGTGKELLARAIHANGPRACRPFVPVNCAALPHDLIESELFGHRRGAFSGAVADHPGLFAAAERGTLLLDEIGELPEASQAKLLRVLQSGEIRPVGGTGHRNVDVRVVAATNRSLQALREGALRQDLFYRLAVVVIEVPPLRDRPEDIPVLFDYFLARHRSASAAPLRHVDPKALNLLLGYHFPGNIRELENLAEFLCTMLPPDRTSVCADDVGRRLHRQRAGESPGTVPEGCSLNLRRLEAWAIHEAIERAGGNKSRAAAILGVSRDKLHRKLREARDADRPARGFSARAGDDVDENESDGASPA